jgi:hypothetical protein
VNGVLRCLVLLMLFLLSPSVWAQEHAERVTTLGESVEEAVPSVLDDAAELVELTLALYAVADAHDGDCPALGKALSRFLDSEQARLDAVLGRLRQAADGMDEQQRAVLAAFLADALWDALVLNSGRERLYACLHSWELQGERRLVKRAMERFFEAHRALLLAFVGNVD